MATRGMRGPGDDHTTLILDSGDETVLHTCLNDTLSAFDSKDLTDPQFIYKDALERIRSALAKAKLTDVQQRTHLRVVRPTSWERQAPVNPLATKEDVEAALGDVEVIFEQAKITQEDRDTIWQAMGAFCLYQVENRKGPFFDAAQPLLRP